MFADFAPAALIPNSDVKLLEGLGEGGFAKVYRGLLTRGVSHDLHQWESFETETL